MTIKTREEIDKKDTWDLSVIFKDTKEFNNYYDETSKLIKDFVKYKDHVMDSAKSFYNVILDDIEISRRIEKLYSYASMMSDVDVSCNANQELVSRVLLLFDEYQSNSYFVRVEILNEDYSKIEDFYKEEEKLLEHKISIERIYRYKEHTLSSVEEKLLSSLGKSIGNHDTTYSYLSDSDLEFDPICDENGKKVELTDTTYSLYIRSKNRKVREDAFNSIYTRYKQFRNTFSSILDGHIKENVSYSHIRNYESSFKKSLFSDDLDIKIYNTLKDTVHANISVYQKYFSLKKKVLGLSDMHLYDIYSELVKDYDKKYSFDEAKTIIFEAIKPLGDDCSEKLALAFKERWIDKYPNKNKRGGAYSGGSYDTYPYVLLNYQEKLDDVSTLIHELGHSMHSYYSRLNQPYQYGDYPIFVAEVASTTNELLLAYYFINNSNDKNEKLSAINHLLELFKGTIFRQTMFEEFEIYAYDLVENGGVITADKLCNKYLELNKEYFGDSVIVDDLIQYEWERVPHFYYNFYVYKYATSLSAACSIVKKILSGDRSAVDNYLTMLKSGCVKNAYDTLKIAGVDMMKKEVYQDAMDMFNDMIDEFIKVLGGSDG